MNYREYINIVNSVTCPYADKELSWILSRKPYIVMAVALLSWLVAFLLVIILLIDAPKSSALPVRLTVFALPLASLAFGYVVRWKRRRLRGDLLVKMLHNSIFVNKTLQEDSKSVITTVTCNEKGTFHIFFIYFEMSGCVNAIDLLLNTYIEEDIQKILLLVEFHADDRLHLTKSSLSKRLIVIMAAMYGFYLQRQLLPTSSQERHMKQRQCLCQFVEECLSNVLFSLNKNEEDFYDTYAIYLGIIRTQNDLNNLFQKMKATDECHDDMMCTT